MGVFVIAAVDVTDPDKYITYASLTVAIAEKFGGNFLVKGGDPEWVEGDGPGRFALISFPDKDTAKAFYYSDQYQAILPIAMANSTRTMVIVEGV